MLLLCKSFGQHLARLRFCHGSSSRLNFTSGMYGSGYQDNDYHYGGQRGGRPHRGRYRNYCSGRGGRNWDNDRHEYNTPNDGREHGPHQGHGRRSDWRSRNQDGYNDRRQRDGKDRPPHGLRGKEIGLYYAKKGQQRRAQLEKQMRPEVKFEDSQVKNISSLLKDIKSSRECPPQPSRSYSDLPGNEEESFDLSRVKIESCDKMMDNSGPFKDNLKISVKMENTETMDSDSKFDTSAMSRTVSVKRERDDSEYNFHNDTPIKSEIDEKFAMKAEPSVEVIDLDSYEDGSDDNENIEDISGVIDVMQMKAEEDFDVNNVVLPHHSNQVDSSELDERLHEDFINKQNNQKYLDMKKFRQKLPSYEHRQHIVDLISQNQVVVLSGETGCGKTTQVPQFILDDYLQKKRGSQCRIVCTQPRRISAITVAERVAAERAESCGNSAGFLIRLENKLPRTDGSILYCTTGILLKVLEDDPLLEMATHIILDEIHERDLLSDFLIIILRDVLVKRPDLKVILMSATLNAEAFSEYFDNCPMYNIPGFTYPVEEFYLEDTIEMLQYKTPENTRVLNVRNGRIKLDELRKRQEVEDWVHKLRRGEISDKHYSDSTYDTLLKMDIGKIDLGLVKELIKYIVTSKDGGAILVFLPGWAEISDLHKSLSSETFFQSNYFKIIPLHSMMPTVNQREVFEKPEFGVKIILATNIAETSITIDDVVYVIDCGRIKVKGFSPENNLSTLNSEMVSLANAKQRRGRAGRVQAGECYHLYTSQQQSKLMEYLPPEILRTRLEELCLQIKYLKLGAIIPFVSKALQPPSLAALNTAIVNLQRMNALDSEENLLPLGKHLARMPLDPHTGKMILFGAMFGCLDPILTIAACLAFRDPFFSPLGKEKLVEERKRLLAEDSFSDHLLLVKTYNKWRRCVNRGTNKHFCYQNFLSESTLRMLHKMRKQLSEVLMELGFLSGPTQQQANKNSDNEDLVKAIVCAGLYPNVAKVTKGKTKIKLMKLVTEDETKCDLHPKSVAMDLHEPIGQWIVYHMKMKTSKVFIYDLSPVSPYALLFFGGDISQVMDGGVQTVCVDDWIRFKASPDTVSLVKDLRKEMDMMLDSKISDTKGSNWGATEGAIIGAIIDLITKKNTDNAGYSHRR